MSPTSGTSTSERITDDVMWTPLFFCQLSCLECHHILKQNSAHPVNHIKETFPTGLYHFTVRGQPSGNKPLTLHGPVPIFIKLLSVKD